MDQLVWLTGVFYKCAVEKGTIDLVLSDGRRLQGALHGDWRTCDNRCLLTTVDLKDAYKQLGIHETDRNKAIVTLRSDLHDGVDCYELNCLPFGAAASRSQLQPGGKTDLGSRSRLLETGLGELL